MVRSPLAGPGAKAFWHLNGKHLNQKGPAVGGFLDELGGGLTGPMPGPRLNTNQRGCGSRLRRLERCREFEAVRWNHPVVVVASGDQRGRIGRAGLEVVQR